MRCERDHLIPLRADERLSDESIRGIEVLKGLPAVRINNAIRIGRHSRRRVYRQVASVIGIGNAARTHVSELIRAVVVPEVEYRLACNVSYTAWSRDVC
jgi:hypothetical protein